jgi:hypothetical protein
VLGVSSLPATGSGGYLEPLDDERTVWQIMIGAWLIMGSIALISMRSRAHR